MSRLRVAAIVEGHGEVQALPILIQRIWTELLGCDFVEVLTPPIRQKRHQLATNKDGALSNAVCLAANKLESSRTDLDDPELILILVDADDDLPCKLGPEMQAVAVEARCDFDVSCVVANVDYETWFVAASSSLLKFWKDPESFSAPANPEGKKGKGWVKKRFNGAKYSETIDQAKLTAQMDLAACRSGSRSFDKLCRELQKKIDKSGEQA